MSAGYPYSDKKRGIWGIWGSLELRVSIKIGPVNEKGAVQM